MPLPNTPSEIKALIAKPGGSMCEKFMNLVNNLPTLVWLYFSYMYNEDGTFTEEFKADFCALSCKCGPGGVVLPGGLSAPVVSASDGQYADRVQIVWDTVNGATAYDVYRNTLNNPASANSIATNLATPTYDDTSVTVGQYYYYWVKARSATAASPFSNGDRGHAGSISETLPAITDLAATQGFGESGGKISLVWTPVAGAESYDIYRSSTNEFATATLIDSNRTAFDNSLAASSYGPTPVFIDNGGELVYLHDPGSPSSNYRASFYFWVIAKRGGPAAQSQPSNVARGWVQGIGDGTMPHVSLVLESGNTYTIPSGVVRYWSALHGSGAGGAGGGLAHGGGGGGGGPVLTGWFNVVAGGKLRVVSTPEADTTNAAAEANGQNSAVTKLQYSANGLFTDTIDLMTANAAGGGQYNPAGYGVGGAGATGTKHASVQEGGIFVGRDGKAADGNKGGRSGTRFGNFRWPGAHYNGFGPGSFAGFGSTRGAASGSYASPTTLSLAQGGRGARGWATLIQYTS